MRGYDPGVGVEANEAVGSFFYTVTAVDAGGVPIPGATMEFREMVRDQIASAYGFWWRGDRLHYHRGPRRRPRCPACNPRGYTPRLCINGREYRRRQQARRRR